MKLSTKMKHGENAGVSISKVSVPSLLYQVTHFCSDIKLCDFSLAIKRFSVSLNNCVLLIVYSTFLTNIIRSSFTIIGIRSYLAGVC